MRTLLKIAVLRHLRIVRADEQADVDVVAEVELGQTRCA